MPYKSACRKVGIEREARLNCGPMILASASSRERGADADAQQRPTPCRQRPAPAFPTGRPASPCWLAWVLHAVVLALGLLGEPPRFGFAPALSVTAWLVLTVYAVERQMFPQLEARWALAGLGSAAVLLALVFPGSELHVSASPWLPLHWALGIASYGLFAAAVVHAWLMTRAERSIRHAADPQAGLPLLTLERLTFRFATAGFVLLSATLLAGLLFSDTLVWPRAAGALGPQDGVFRAGMAGIRLPPAGTPALRLARPQGCARPLRRLAAVAAGVRGVAFRARSGAEAARVKYLLVLVVVLLVLWLWRSSRRSGSGDAGRAPGRAGGATGHGAMPDLRGAPAAVRCLAGAGRPAVLLRRTPPARGGLKCPPRRPTLPFLPSVPCRPT